MHLCFLVAIGALAVVVGACASPEPDAETGTGASTGGGETMYSSSIASTSTTDDEPDCSSPFISVGGESSCGDVGNATLCYSLSELLLTEFVEAPTAADVSDDKIADVLLPGISPLRMRIFTAQPPCGLEERAALSVEPRDSFVADLLLDVDSDGDLDVLLVQLDAGATLFVNQGGGVDFVPMPLPGFPLGYPDAAGDLNGDGHTDIVGVSGGEFLRIVSGDGTGHFVEEPTVALDGWPNYAAIVDFDENGVLDIVTHQQVNLDDLNSIDEGVVLLGDIPGSFSSRVTYAVGEWPIDVLVEDFDADGHVDFAVEGWVHYGTGTGVIGRSLAVELLGYNMAGGDLNGDGLVDIMNYADIFLNDGEGFQGGFEGFPLPVDPAIADVDGDGIMDIVGITPQDAKDHLTIFRGLPQ